MCKTPNTINLNQKLQKTVNVPCGKCHHCLQKRRGQWAFRLQQELKTAHTASFITLTYDEDQIPRTECGWPTLEPKDLQNFWKRLRKYTAYHHQHKIKYLAVGEYGTQTKRPHYHAITFNLPQHLLKNATKLPEIWNKGLTHIGDANDKSILYTLSYLTAGNRESKKQIIERTQRGIDHYPEFQRQSQGIGTNYLTPQQIQFQKNNLNPYIIAEDGKKMSMPRYYKDKIFNKTEKYLIKKKIEKLNYQTPEEYNSYNFREQTERIQYWYQQNKIKQQLNKKSIL